MSSLSGRSILQRAHAARAAGDLLPELQHVREERSAVDSPVAVIMPAEIGGIGQLDRASRILGIYPTDEGG